jgi:hypothetical protein
MACYGCILKEKWSNDAIFHHATPHINLWHVPQIFSSSLKWLATQNSAVMHVHNTIQMDCCLIIKTESRRVSSLSIFCRVSSQNLLQQSQSAGLMWCCNCNLYAHKCKHLCTKSWTVEWGRCSCLLAVRINLHRLCRNARLLHSTLLDDPAVSDSKHFQLLWCVYAAL